MRRMKVGVVADDVTGANDIGVCFKNGGYKSAVFPLELIKKRNMKEEAKGLNVIIIDTESRFDTPEVAAKKVKEATEILLEISCDRYFNKTCSVFRGNIGAEFDSMQRTLLETSSMVVLGFPQNGRTTLEGIHYVYGTKLEDSQFRNDPIHPMTISYLPNIIQKQSAGKVGLITFHDLDHGLDHVKRKKEELKKECAYILFDIRNQEDLRLVADAVAEERNICGSSAIGEFLPKAYQNLYTEVCSKKRCNEDKVFLVAGSLTTQSKAQTEHICSLGWKVRSFDSQSIFDESTQKKEENRLIEELTEAVEENGIAMLCSEQDIQSVESAKELGRSRFLSWEEVGKRISGSLSYIAEKVMENTDCRNLVVAGGDTSAAVTRQLEIYRMEVGHEIEPGVPIMKGKCKLGELNLVLKSGSFGSETFLEKAAKETIEYGGSYD